MKTIDLATEQPQLAHIFDFAENEPVLLLTGDGREFIVSQADDFDQEVEALRNSPRFQTFLDERMKCKTRIPIDDIEREIDAELRG